MAGFGGAAAAEREVEVPMVKFELSVTSNLASEPIPDVRADRGGLQPALRKTAEPISLFPSYAIAMSALKQVLICGKVHFATKELAALSSKFNFIVSSPLQPALPPRMISRFALSLARCRPSTRPTASPSSRSASPMASTVKSQLSTITVCPTWVLSTRSSLMGFLLV